MILVSASRVTSESDYECIQDTHPWRYIQGAGDDEESWAQGLTPELFWTHKHELLRGPVEECLRQARALVSSQHRSIGHEWLSQNIAVVNSTSVQTSFDPSHAVPPHQIHEIESTGIAVARAAAVVKEEALTSFKAALNLGARGHPAEELFIAGAQKYYLFLPVSEGKRHKYGLEDCLSAAVEFVSLHILAGRRTIIFDASENMSVCVCAAVLVHLLDIKGLQLLTPCEAPEISGGLSSTLPWAWATGDSRTENEHSKNRSVWVNKETIRRRLTFVSNFTPDLIPSRLLIQQLKRHFLTRGEHQHQ
eukprot:CAMPEP_0184647478 /NCGR_PEP_ID=MMETSP0308-20130426/4423_1 /TAXON_ID=38269 /ORGANISM="Gloeochaete witrockiana, Strain SAG 46.84" /LENGTH=305 /DNA_ID=CAMNT_0027078485 /DNA_START=626 /DNA_END=1543 /DNA_ORIENTATION=+